MSGGVLAEATVGDFGSLERVRLYPGQGGAVGRPRGFCSKLCPFVCRFPSKTGRL